jgi:hypothetical protein
MSCTVVPIIPHFIISVVSRDISVGIATRYGMDGTGIGSGGGGGAGFYAPVQNGPGTHPASYIIGTGSLYRG